MKLVKAVKVIPCDKKVSNLGYNKILFDDGSIQEAKSMSEEIIHTSTSELVYGVYPNGNYTLNRVVILEHRAVNECDKNIIRITSHRCLEKYGYFYTISKKIEIDNNTFEKYWDKKVFKKS